jgi:hypothetical protein
VGHCTTIQSSCEGLRRGELISSDALYKVTNGSFQDRHFYKAYDSVVPACPVFSLILLKNDFNKKKNRVTLKTDSALCTRSQSKYVKFVSYPWPPVVATLSIPTLFFLIVRAEELSCLVTVQSPCNCLIHINSTYE